MSLLSSEQVRLVLRTDTVKASVWAGRFRPNRVAELEIAFDPGARSPDADARVLRELLNKLARKHPIAGAPLHIELVDALVHFDVAEGEFAGLGARTIAGFADACMAELLGERVGDHVLRWQLQRDERHLLVCALPRRWLDAVAAAALPHRLKVVAVRPSFHVQWNQHVGGRRSADLVFAVAEGMHTLIACVRDGVITAVSNGPWNADRAEHGDSTVDRLLAGIGLAGKGSVALIDVQVDRLLAGLGIAPAARAKFVLVSATEPHVYLSHRWAVQQPRGARA